MAVTSSRLSLQQQIKQQLTECILNGLYKNNQQLPTEHELEEKFSVSRVTIRGALSELEKEGLIVRYRGRGTFVTDHSLKRNISSNSSFSAICREIGLNPGAKTIKSIFEDATESDIRELQLQENAKVIVLERIRYADSIPVSVEYSRFPESFSFLIDEDLTNASLSNILSEKHGIRFNGTSRKIIKQVYASYEQAKYLNLPTHYPLISIECVSFDTNNTPCHRSRQLIVGDRFELYI